MYIHTVACSHPTCACAGRMPPALAARYGLQLTNCCLLAQPRKKHIYKLYICMDGCTCIEPESASCMCVCVCVCVCYA